MLTALIVVFHVLFSLILILFILLHRGGAGGGLSDLFGGASSLTGSAVVERNLDRLTVVSAVGFVITTVFLSLRLK